MIHRVLAEVKLTCVGVCVRRWVYYIMIRAENTSDERRPPRKENPDISSLF